MNLSDEVDLETFVSRFPSPSSNRPRSFIPRVSTYVLSHIPVINKQSDMTECLRAGGRPDKISNADIAAICLEAGMQAVRKNRCVCMTGMCVCARVGVCVCVHTITLLHTGTSS
jgi:SpoVK/Ycf46/Vps4 family AAA+-type ATPase